MHNIILNIINISIPSIQRKDGYQNSQDSLCRNHDQDLHRRFDLPPALDLQADSSAALTFVRDFYYVLASRRHLISTLYVPPPSTESTTTAPAPSAVGATIVINGKVYPDGRALQEKFKNDMPPTHFETDSVDCHILNPEYNPTNQAAGKPASVYMTLLVMVSGTVRFSNDRKAPTEVFSDTLVLIPNDPGSKRSGDSKDWVVQSQTFRLV